MLETARMTTRTRHTMETILSGLTIKAVSGPLMVALKP